MSNSPDANGSLPSFSSIKPEEIEPAITRLLDDNRSRLNDIVAATGADTDFEHSILPLEELGSALHQAWAPVSHLHGVANSPELREAYNRCLPLIARYETEISQDERICKLFQDVAKRIDGTGRQAERRLLELGLRDFHLAGVDLPTAEKRRFKEIAEELSGLQARFEQNVLDSMAAWSHHETNSKHVSGIPAVNLEQARDAAANAGLEGWLFKLDQPSYVAVVTHADHRDLRRQFYRAWATRASDQEPSPPEFDNSEIIEQILRLRHEAADLVGFASYAEYSLASKMAESVDEVMQFLDELATRSHEKAAEELSQLERFAGQALAAWDIAYYAEKLRQDQYAVSDAELRPYFPLDRVLAGLFSLVERIYGLRIEHVDDVDVWETDVRYHRIVNDDGDVIGGFYTDLFARPQKRSGAWMDECLNRMDWPGVQQAPVAHLVCNFARPTTSTPSLLNHDEVLTLFHEFGHTLHHVLTRVPFPSVAGINGVPWDAVELPSQFMENFAWAPEVLPMISGHYRTGDPLPDETLQRLRASRVFHAAMQMVRQLEFSLFDLRLHGEYDPARGSRLARILEDVRNRVAVVRHPEYNRFAHAFSHIFGGGYAAGYYSYKWAEVLAADAWSAFEDGGTMNRELAERFRQEILEVGGTVEISDAFAAFRGRAAQLEPLLRQSGILPATGSAGPV
ncbi:MAG: M3 family metallopeptidase [Gammaproteobacteria bacterium]|nr:M3 family metallopeptidase [Gammaproteobacteria bacterium]